MASTADNALTAGPEVQVSDSEILPAEESKASRRSFYRLESGSLVPCEPNAAQIITYTSPTIDDEAELLAGGGGRAAPGRAGSRRGRGRS